MAYEGMRSCDSSSKCILVITMTRFTNSLIGRDIGLDGSGVKREETRVSVNDTHN